MQVLSLFKTLLVQNVTAHDSPEVLSTVDDKKLDCVVSTGKSTDALSLYSDFKLVKADGGVAVNVDDDDDDDKMIR